MVKDCGKSSYYDANDTYFSKNQYKHSIHPYEGRNYDLFAITVLLFTLRLVL